jgi:hypothetical protein
MPIFLITHIAPKNNQDFPTHFSTYGKGGWHEAATLVARNALPAARRTAGMACRVLENDTTYILQADLTTWIADTTSGIPEAPIDGKPYVRMDGDWGDLDDLLDEGTYA